MKKLIDSLPLLCLFLLACTKSELPVTDDCISQTTNPIGNSYFEGDVKQVSFSGNHCGLMPLNAKNEWIYEDSIFDNTGNLKTVLKDTLSYTKTLQTPDHLIWWEGNKDVGLPIKIYSSTSAIYGLHRGFFIADTFYSKAEFAETLQDSASFRTSFGDIVAFGKTIRKSAEIKTPAGTFSNYILFEKYSPGYRRDRVFFVPGFGVVQYTIENYKSPGPLSNMRLQKKSTLISFHS